MKVHYGYTQLKNSLFEGKKERKTLTSRQRRLSSIVLTVKFSVFSKIKVPKVDPPT